MAELHCCGDAKSNQRLADLRQRAASVAAVETAIADYVAAGGGLPVVVVVCPACVARGKVADGRRSKGKKAA